MIKYSWDCFIRGEKFGQNYVYFYFGILFHGFVFVGDADFVVAKHVLAMVYETKRSDLQNTKQKRVDI